MSVFPNPFSDNTIIEFGEMQKHTTIKVSDVVGKTIMAEVIKYTKSFSIERGTIKSGIYFLQITDCNNNIINRKIIVE